MISGKSDQVGCLDSVRTSRSRAVGVNDSCEMTAAPAPRAIASQNSSLLRHAVPAKPSFSRTSHARRASRPMGASTRTRSCSPASEFEQSIILKIVRIVNRAPAHDAAKLPERLTDPDSIFRDLQLAYRAFVRSGAPFQYRNGLTDFAAVFEITKYQ